MCHLPTMGQMAHQNTQPQRPAEAHWAIPKVGDEKEEQLYPNGALRRSLYGYPKTLAEPYRERLTKIITLMPKIGFLYNKAMKALNIYHSIAIVQQMIGKLETYT